MGVFVLVVLVVCCLYVVCDIGEDGYGEVGA